MAGSTDNDRPIATIAVPLVAVLTLVGSMLYVGVQWWHASLENTLREAQSLAAVNRLSIEAVRDELRSHDVKEGHTGVLSRVSGIDRELSSLREKLATFDSTVLQRDLERQRRIDVLESVAVKRNVEWVDVLQRIVRLETEMDRVCGQKHTYTLLPPAAAQAP